VLKHWHFCGFGSTYQQSDLLTYLLNSSPSHATEAPANLFLWTVNSFSTQLLSSCTDKYAHTYNISSYWVSSRGGRTVIFCRIPDSVNRRLISGRFWIRIFDVTLPLVYTYKNYSKSCPMLYFSVIFTRQ